MPLSSQLNTHLLRNDPLLFDLLIQCEDFKSSDYTKSTVLPGGQLVKLSGLSRKSSNKVISRK